MTPIRCRHLILTPDDERWGERMAFLTEAEPPDGLFVWRVGPRGARGPVGERGEQGEQGPPVDPEHTHDIADVTGLGATLESKADLVGGVVPLTQIPAFRFPLSVVESEAEMLALDGLEGDLVIRVDEGAFYVHNAGSSGTLADWDQIDLGIEVASVNGQTGTVVLTAADVGAVARSLVDAKGDLLVGTADDTAARVPVGADRAVLTARSGEAAGVAWEIPTVAVSTVTAAHTLTPIDAASVVRVNSSSPLAVTVPANSAVAFPVGSVVNVRRVGTGAVTIQAAGGVTVNSVDGLRAVRERFEEVSLHKVAADVWDLVGALA